jgi:signal transduction histidine kinase
LLSNAIKFTAEGEITFVVTKIEKPHKKAGKSIIRFAVTDKGTGVVAAFDGYPNA